MKLKAPIFETKDPIDYIVPGKVYDVVGETKLSENGEKMYLIECEGEYISIRPSGSLHTNGLPWEIIEE